MMGALTMPEVVLLAPLVIQMSEAGLAGTYWAVIIPLVALQIPFTVLLTRAYVDGIPTLCSRPPASTEREPGGSSGAS